MVGHYYTHTCLLRWNRQCSETSVYIKFRRRGITQKKTYNIQNTTKVWNQEFVISICSHRTNQLPMTDFYETSYWSIFKKSVENVKVFVQFWPGKTSTLRKDQCTFMIISHLIILSMKNALEKCVKKWIHIFYIQQFLSKICAFCKIKPEKPGRAIQATYDDIIRRRNDALFMPNKWCKDTDTLS
jgi:hypothetical protein